MLQFLDFFAVGLFVVLEVVRKGVGVSRIWQTNVVLLSLESICEGTLVL